ncbi:hypothetical protein JFL55_05830 [Histophilus somni]|uniref:hypothetical protein n=1 Tax=Histophilus somni TaxID=731 RepID=UPI0018EC18E1|nr:hypothetical protein [Histophilus somni]QQF85329.1 hypothetical protein JFL55_05830 [Histophilus somni]
MITVGNNNGDNSFALGDGSQIVNKKTAPSGTIQNVGKDDLTINWKNAGTSKDEMDTNKKEVISVGSSGAERIITHVAAGEVRDGSTDAINGGQLYSVINTFGHLGFSVLGAEKEDKGKAGFKLPTFAKLKNANGAEDAAPTTFKQAIEKSIETINKGLKFKGDKSAGSNNEAKQLYLGSTLTIKGAESTAQTPAQGAGAAKHQNITTTAKDGGILEIALNTNLKDITSIGKDENNVLTFKNSTSGSSGTSPTATLKVGGASLTFTKADGYKITIRGLAYGKSDGDAVTVKQLTASQLHYLSVMGTEKNGGSNYNNDGAKGTHSVAIGIRAMTEMTADHSIVLGNDSQSKSKYGVAIGNNAVIENGSDHSIIIATGGNSDKSQISNAKWAVSIGNKNNITGGNDIVALGSNINVTSSSNGSNGNKNDSLVVIGNKAMANNAKWSTAVGAETQVKSIQSLALGYQAKVLENSDASIAIGVSGETKIINSKWSTALGNKIAITGSDNNILALGSNIRLVTNNAN